MDAAKKLIDAETSDTEKYTVIVAQCIHSIIRANDALTTKFLNKRAIRHDEAPQLFLELVRLNMIHSKFSDLRNTIITPAIQAKSKADYKGLSSSKAGAEDWIRSAEKFLGAVKECLSE